MLPEPALLRAPPTATPTPANLWCALPTPRSTGRLTATHPVPHPSRYPLRWAGRRDPRGWSGGWMLIAVTAYLQEHARCVIDTEARQRGSAAARHRGSPAARQPGP